MEAVITAVVGTVIEVFTGRFLTYSGRRIGYVIHYKKNMEDLDSKVEALRGVRDSIQEKVRTAEDNAEVIEKDVSDWLTKVSKKVDDLDRLAERGNIKSCFHVCSRYRLSKECKELLCDVPQLIESGGKFDTVSDPAIWYTATTNFEPFKSRESVCEQIIELLRDDKNYTIGIHGMGGSGKTRMAQEIAKQAKKEKLFDEVAMAVFTQDQNLEKIQKELADCLKLTFSTNTNTNMGRKGALCKRLKNGNKILVIIDDIWSDKVKLEEIGIPSNGDKDCKVLLTSRSKNVLIKMGVLKNFRLENLKEDEAWKLFKKTVGDFIESPSEINSIAKQVCRKCGNLPLAILVVGAALRNKENYAWYDALEQFKHCMGDNIEGVSELYSCIELSYKFLELSDLRSCFLHCSLFPEDAQIPIDDLVMYGVGTRFLSSHTMEAARARTFVLVDTLKNSNLLLEGRNKNFVKMHDVIRDVAISIASKEGFLAEIGVPEWPEKEKYKSCKVISLRSKNICKLPDELECPELSTLVLECVANCRLPNRFFNGAEKVEVLDLHHVRLPSSLQNLVNLRMLRLHECEQVNLALLKELINLKILSIADFALKEVAVEVGQLTSLHWLDLSSCEHLETIPSGVIKSLSKIEELYFPFNFNGWKNEGNARLDELNSLTHLTTLQIHIEDGMLLPNEHCFKSLNRFQISIGMKSGFSYFDQRNRYFEEGARILKINCTTLRKEFNILMEKTEVLFLKRVDGLKNVLHCADGKGFLDLKYLETEDCSDMEHLLGGPKWNLENQGSFNQLNVLEVQNCKLKFLFFPSMARALLQLQELDISDCKIMEEIIFNDEKRMDKVTFHQLKKMRLHNLQILRSICANTKKTSTTECSTSTNAQALLNEKVSFLALEELHISGLDSVTTIWDNQLLVSTSVQQLTSLTIGSCHSLRNVFSPSIAKNLRQLQELTVNDCEKIEDIIAVETVQGEEDVTNDEIIVFLQLKKMKLKGLPNLKSFWSGFEKAAVKNDIPQVQALFNHKVKFPSLENFEYYENKNNLKEIWSSTVPIDAFCKLRKLTVKHCDKLLSIAPPSKLLQNLEELYIEGCPNLEKGLETTGVEEVSTSFEQLTSLTIDSCHSLINVFSPSIAKNLRQLQELTVRDCEKIEEIIVIETVQEEEETTDDEIIVFHQLKKMKLESLPNLKSFWSGSKKAAMENDIPQVQALFNNKVKFPSLENFAYCQNKNNLKEIWSSTVPTDAFCKLRTLRVEHCDKLLSIAPPSKLLQNLEILYIADCLNLEKGLETTGVEKVSTSFSRLTLLDIDGCHSLRNVFSPSMARNLQQLQNLTVRNCEKIEEIIAVETVQGEEEVTDNEIIVLSQLKNMKFQELPNLKSFCSCTCGSNKEAEEDNIPQVHALFNYKVKFPSLEEFEYSLNKNVKGIWSSTCKLRKLRVEHCDKLLSIAPPSKLLQNLEELYIAYCPDLKKGLETTGVEKVSTSFQQLTSLTIYFCHSLRNVFSPSTAKNLRQLQELTISDCEKIENIIAVETVQGEEEVTDDEIIVFHQLKKMKLESLPNLKSFWSGSKKAVENDILQAQALFNNKVKFPSLEEFEYRWNENNLKEIWSSTVPSDAFCKLRKLSVEHCEKLLSIAPPSKLLQNLEELYIYDCPNLEKGLETTGVEKVSTSFQQLTSLTIDNCHSLRNVFSPSIAKNLRQLQVLTVNDCEKIEDIIAVETVQREEEVADDEIIVFPQLKRMKLEFLPNLKSFCSSTCGSNKEAVEDDIPQVHALFNYKVKFPSLEEFSYYWGSNTNLKEIWNTTVPIDYFCKLRTLIVNDCDELLSVAPSKLLGSFHNLEELCIYNCPSLEEIFKVEGKSNNAEEGIVVARDKDIEEDLETISELPSLVKMEITNCPKLKSAAFYTSKEKVVFPILETLRLSDESIFEDIWYGHVPTGSFSKVRKLTIEECSKLVNASTLLQRFEVVERLTIISCSSLEVVFNLEGLEDIERGRITKLELLAFHNLKSLVVESCNNLKYLFSLSMARNLTKIAYLSVCSCDAIEEVIRNEDQGEEDGVMDEIVFPKLRSMHLQMLANLTSFCGANNAFKLPSLQSVRLRECPKMQTFTSGRISTQLIELRCDNYFDVHKVSDLNKYVEQCVEKRKGRRNKSCQRNQR